MPLDLDAVQKFINSPPGQIAAGSALAAIVWKFFERVEAILKEDTKYEIAVWLVGVKTEDKVPWPETFSRIVNRLFGENALSWRCFRRSFIASYLFTNLLMLVKFFSLPGMLLSKSVLNSSTIGERLLVLPLFLLASFPVLLITNAIPDYLSLLKTRFALRRASAGSSPALLAMLLAGDLIGSLALGMVSAVVVSAVAWALLNAVSRTIPEAVPPFLVTRFDSGVTNYVASSIRLLFTKREFNELAFFVYPAFFTSIWLWLYAGSGLVLKAARRFDVGFQWFNRKADIEKKPLQAIGLVAGSVVACCYWLAVGSSWYFRK